jgi:hypothetical protein
LLLSNVKRENAMHKWHRCHFIQLSGLPSVCNNSLCFTASGQPDLIDLAPRVFQWQNESPPSTCGSA